MLENTVAKGITTALYMYYNNIGLNVCMYIDIIASYELA